MIEVSQKEKVREEGGDEGKTKISQSNFDLKPRKLFCHQICRVPCVLKYSDRNHSASSSLKLEATGFFEMSV